MPCALEELNAAVWVLKDRAGVRISSSPQERCCSPFSQFSVTKNRLCDSLSGGHWPPVMPEELQ
jgi:hypothetical protein